MRSKLLIAAVALGGLTVTMAAHAGVPANNVPEPGTWALVGLAAAVGWAVTRSKRK
jgi:opacity protein-like surface antigen